MRLLRTCALVALAMALAAPAGADVVQLLDGTKMNAKLVHYYDGLFTFEVGGKPVKVPRSKIRSMTLELPAPCALFATPEKTFNCWLTAMVVKDFQTMNECYALMYQGMAARQFESLTDKEKESMWQQALAMKLTWGSVEIKGDQAIATVSALRDGERDKGHLSFVRENGEWKMTPGPMVSAGCAPK